MELDYLKALESEGKHGNPGRQLKVEGTNVLSFQFCFVWEQAIVGSKIPTEKHSLSALKHQRTEFWVPITAGRWGGYLTKERDRESESWTRCVKSAQIRRYPWKDMCKRLTAGGLAKVKKNRAEIGGAARETESEYMSPMNHASLRTQLFSLMSDLCNVNTRLPTVHFPVWISYALFTVFGFRRQARDLKYLEPMQSLIQDKSLIGDFKENGSATVPIWTEQSPVWVVKVLLMHSDITLSSCACCVCFSEWGVASSVECCNSHSINKHDS